MSEIIIFCTYYYGNWDSQIQENSGGRITLKSHGKLHLAVNQAEITLLEIPSSAEPPSSLPLTYTSLPCYTTVA